MKENQVIIAIGAGRSGSTLLTRMLNSHPHIKFGGETDFLVPRLWGELWENRFWFHWKLQSESNSYSAVSLKDGFSLYDLRVESDLDVDPLINEKFRQKAASTIQCTIKTILDLDGSPIWGYKELWNGSSDFLYDWKVYDYIFPHALWLHMVRNPFIHAKSCALWLQQSLDLKFLINQLTEWREIIKYSHKRIETGRYYEIRYEDLITSPQTVLGSVLNACGVEWTDDILLPLRKPIMKSFTPATKCDFPPLTLDDIKYLFNRVDGLQALCEEYGYLPRTDISNYFVSCLIEAKSKSRKKVELNIRQKERETSLMEEHSVKEREWLGYLSSYAMKGSKALKRSILNRPYQHEMGFSWIISLPGLNTITDDNGNSSRSNLLLYEDGRLLQPAHALHDDIRKMGGGRYSHWNDSLHFSTSDGSDPNINGRNYTILYISPDTT